jgi:sulfur relay (sulfurtransferase) DsrC/TusE family protein
MGIEVNGTTYETDEEGYLLNLSEWTRTSARCSPRAKTSR